MAEAPALRPGGELGLLVRARLRELGHRVRGLVRESLFKLGFILVFALCFWVGLFWGFLRSFLFVDRFPGLREVLLEQLFSLLFFALLVMITFSTGIISFGALFRSRESTFLLGQPLRPESLFAYKFLESLLFSSWALVFLGAPVLLAYGIAGRAPAYFFPLGPLLLVPFVMLPAALGTGLTLLIVRFLPGGRRRALLWAGLAAAAGVGFLLYRLTAGLGGRMPLTEAWLWNALKRFRFVRSSLLPSYWLTESILALGRGHPARATFFSLVIASNTAFLLLLLYRFAARSYLLSYSRAQGFHGRRRRRRRSLVAGLVRGLFWYLDEPTRLLIRRDVLSFIRDPVQWSQVLIFFGLLAIYFFNLRRFYYHVSGEFWKLLVSLLNLGATCLTLATFTSRFVYPQVSLEAQKMWVVGVAPVSRRKLLMAKFVSALAGSVLLAGGLVGLSNWMLGMPVPVAVLQFSVAVLVGVGLSALAVGLGASYPNLRESDPSKIVAGFGGTLTLVAGLAFLAVMLAQTAVLSKVLFEAGWAAGSRVYPWLALGGALLAAGAVTTVPLALGIRRFERMEF